MQTDKYGFLKMEYKIVLICQRRNLSEERGFMTSNGKPEMLLFIGIKLYGGTSLFYQTDEVI